MLTKPRSLDPQLWSEVMEALVPRYCQLAGHSRDKDNLRKVGVAGSAMLCVNVPHTAHR
jgi:hypothetical protein